MLAGCLTANFLSGLGSTIGDNTTALFCLASILATLHAVSTLSVRSAHATGTFASSLSFHAMWQTLDNLPFAQSGNVLPNPLANATGVADTSRLPKRLWQQLLPWALRHASGCGKGRPDSDSPRDWPIAYLFLILVAIQVLAAKSARRQLGAWHLTPVSWRSSWRSDASCG